MTRTRDVEPEDFEFNGTEGFVILEKRVQLMANILGECVFITGRSTQGYLGLRLEPSSHFKPKRTRAIFFACWPLGFCYDGRFIRRCEDD